MTSDSVYHIFVDIYVLFILFSTTENALRQIFMNTYFYFPTFFKLKLEYKRMTITLILKEHFFSRNSVYVNKLYFDNILGTINKLSK